MKKSALVYWALVVGAGILGGVIMARPDSKAILTGKTKSQNALPLQDTGTSAIACSKDMGKAALLTHFPDSNSREYSLPRRPHN